MVATRATTLRRVPLNEGADCTHFHDVSGGANTSPESCLKLAWIVMDYTTKPSQLYNVECVEYNQQLYIQLESLVVQF